MLPTLSFSALDVDDETIDLVVQPMDYLQVDYDEFGNVQRCYPKIIFDDDSDPPHFIGLGLPFFKSTAMILDYEDYMIGFGHKTVRYAFGVKSEVLGLFATVILLMN